MNKLQMPKIFQDGMVLQRRRPVCIWGTVEGGGPVTVRLNGARVCADCAPDGAWKLFLPPMEAAHGLELTVEGGGETLTIRDVAVGEVWLASGQSNMEYLLRYDVDVETACKLENADIRCFEVPKISYPGQDKDFDFSEVGLWRHENSQDSPYFSAVGFYFANRLHDDLDVPIGIINCSWGGTSAAVFIARDYLTGPLARVTREADRIREEMDYETGLDGYRELQRIVTSRPPRWAIVNTAPIEPDESMLDFTRRMDQYRQAPFSPFRPCGLYETMLLTIVPYTIKGAIWYQGESDVPNADIYARLLTALIRCWRDLWQDEFPFILVQLPGFEYMMEALDFTPIRNAQEEVARTVPQVWMICAMDMGLRYDIHPKEKRPIGERLALQALSKVYGRQDVTGDAPTVGLIKRDGDVITIGLTHCGGGLTCRGDRPEALEAEADGQPVDCTVRVLPDALELSAPGLGGRAVTVRFCQKDFCMDNLYSAAGLPVHPFIVSI